MQLYTGGAKKKPPPRRKVKKKTPPKNDRALWGFAKFKISLNINPHRCLYLCPEPTRSFCLYYRDRFQQNNKFAYKYPLGNLIVSK